MKEITRTPAYLVLSRERGQALYADLLSRTQKIEQLKRLNDALREQLLERDNQLAIALHELAVASKKRDPAYFARQWRKGVEARVNGS